MFSDTVVLDSSSQDMSGVRRGVLYELPSLPTTVECSETGECVDLELGIAGESFVLLLYIFKP
jgi:hypothetical protein